MTCRAKIAIASLGFVLAAMSEANAQAPKALVCDFTAQHVGALEPGYTRQKPTDKLSFTFAALDALKSSAQIIGNAGAAQVIYLDRFPRIQFIEITDAGNIAVTSVFAFSTDQPLPAVHSRHMSFGGKSAVVSQYVGTCTPRF